MTNDIALRWDNLKGGADLCFENGDLVVEDGLKTAAIISLFTDLGSWWDDAGLGSKLHQLHRTILSAQTVREAGGWAEAALAWLKAEGQNVRVVVEPGTQGRLEAHIVLENKAKETFNLT